MKFKLELTYDDNSKVALVQPDSDRTFDLHKFTEFTGWYRLNPYRTINVWTSSSGITAHMLDEARNTMIYGTTHVPNYVRAGSDITVSSVDTEARTVTFHAPDGARQMSRAQLERLYPRVSEVTLSAARNEAERREAQRQADRARLEEERRNRPFWERARNIFR